MARRLPPHLAGDRPRRHTETRHPRAQVRDLLTVRGPGPFTPEVVRPPDSLLSGGRAGRRVVTVAS
ncbi:hypothetical protein [Actinoplanes sp. CA-252034]|uniref:hypothetical protein n=1 Tax=Actinoplanes sp. CA-252034 TaxID=3239906 RepID=UPI003D994D7A